MSNTSQTRGEEESRSLQWTRDPADDHLNYDNDESVAKSITIVHYDGDKGFRGMNLSVWNAFEQFVDEHGIVNRVHKKSQKRSMSPSQEIFWGPGAEARVAWLLIDRAPAMKHEVWNTAQQTLYATPLHPKHTPTIIALIGTAELEERECWQQLDTFASALTLESIATLNLEAVLRLVCSLAGISLGESDPLLVIENLPCDLSDDLVLLRRIHHRIMVLSDGQKTETNTMGNLTGTKIQDQLYRFEQIWTAIVKKLSPGRLANEMNFYADLMQGFLTNDRRYAPSTDEDWARELAMSSIRLYEAVEREMLFREEDEEQYVPVWDFPYTHPRRRSDSDSMC